MAVGVETTSDGKRWFIPPDEPQALLGIGCAALIACAIVIAVLCLLVGRRFLEALFWSAPAYLLSGVVIRAIWLIRRRAQYECLIDQTELRWGWSHRRDEHERLRIADLRSVEYRRGDSDSIDRVIFDVEGGGQYDLDRALAGRPDLVISALEHLQKLAPNLAIVGTAEHRLR